MSNRGTGTTQRNRAVESADPPPGSASAARTHEHGRSGALRRQDVFVVSAEPTFAAMLAAHLAAEASLNVVIVSASERVGVIGVVHRRRGSATVPVVIYDTASEHTASEHSASERAMSERIADDAIGAIARTAPGSHVVAVLPSTSFEEVPALLEAGARGILARDAGREELIRAIGDVAAGHLFASRRMVERMLEHVVAGTRPVPWPGGEERLAPREREVVRLLTKGMTNKEIASSLHLSEATVKGHLGRVMTKWNARDRLQVALRALGSRG